MMAMLAKGRLVSSSTDAALTSRVVALALDDSRRCHKCLVGWLAYAVMSRGWFLVGSRECWLCSGLHSALSGVGHLLRNLRHPLGPQFGSVTLCNPEFVWAAHLVLLLTEGFSGSASPQCRSPRQHIRIEGRDPSAGCVPLRLCSFSRIDSGPHVAHHGEKVIGFLR